LESAKEGIVKTIIAKKRMTRLLSLLIVVVLVLAGVTLAAPGYLDISFDTDGFLTTAIGSGNDLISYTIAIQSDSKIVVPGQSNNGTNNDFALVRYNTDGSLDASFNTDGIVATANSTMPYIH
jgi:uncharacterized delta-60 repeat protein